VPGEKHTDLPVRASDLSTYARIRNSALEGFASNGVAGTSIRDVAAAAGVSPGLVQHHFATKAGLRAAVNEYVMAVALEAFADLVSDDSEEAWSTMGDTVTSWVSGNTLSLRYLGRGLIEGDPDAGEILGGLLKIAREKWLEPLSRARALHEGTDRDWAAIHMILFNLACVLFEPAISRQLPEPFFTPRQLERWNKATTDLYRHGLLSPPASTRSSRARRRSTT
jgi:AcrR family transcriptional regulator